MIAERFANRLGGVFHSDGKLDRNRRNLFRLHRAASRHVMIHGLAFPKGQCHCGLPRFQRCGGYGHHRRDIARLAIGQCCRHRHALHGKHLSGLVGAHCRGCLQLRDHAAIGHQEAGVVFEVERTVFIHDRAADGILRLCAARREDRIGRILSFLHRDKVSRLLPLCITEHPHCAGCVVVEEIDVNIVVAIFRIGR